MTVSMRKVGAMQRLFIVKQMLTAAKSKKNAVAESERLAAETKRTLTAEIERIKTKNESRISALEAEVRLHEETRHAMHDTLVNHKRAMLMEHKVQSSVLQQDLAALIEQKEEIEKQRIAMLKETARVEGVVKEIEHQMHDLSKVSAIQDGKINIAHAKKKRRLDQEFERMLARAQEKRDHLVAIEQKLKQIDESRQEKEDEMKELERNLVALLVEQQKRLLAIIRTDPKVEKRKQHHEGATLSMLLLKYKKGQVLQYSRTSTSIAQNFVLSYYICSCFKNIICMQIKLEPTNKGREDGKPPQITIVAGIEVQQPSADERAFPSAS